MINGMCTWFALTILFMPASGLAQVSGEDAPPEYPDLPALEGIIDNDLYLFFDLYGLHLDWVTKDFAGLEGLRGIRFSLYRFPRSQMDAAIAALQKDIEHLSGEDWSIQQLQREFESPNHKHVTQPTQRAVLSRSAGGRLNGLLRVSLARFSLHGLEDLQPTDQLAVAGVTTVVGPFEPNELRELLEAGSLARIRLDTFESLGSDATGEE